MFWSCLYAWHLFTFLVLMASVIELFFEQVPFPIPLEVNIVLVGFNGDGGYRYSLESRKLASVLKDIFPNHRPTCLGTAQQLDIEHSLYYNVLSVSNLGCFKVILVKMWHFMNQKLAKGSLILGHSIYFMSQHSHIVLVRAYVY